jgi:hypothetical protein
VVWQEEIDENDEKLLEAFLSKDAGPQQTLTDLIIDKIKKRDAHVSSGSYYYMILLFFFKISFCLFYEPFI